MGVEINVKPAALARTVGGKYVSPEQARINRAARKLKNATDAELLELSSTAPLEAEGLAALQIIKERGEAKASEKAALAATWVETKEAVQSNYEYVSNYSSTIGGYFKVKVPAPHPKLHESDGKKVAEVVLKVGTHTFDLGAAVAVQQQTMVTPDEAVLSVDALTETTLPPLKYHTRMTFHMKDWCQVLKAMGWRPTCGNHSSNCENWSHYAPPAPA